MHTKYLNSKQKRQGLDWRDVTLIDDCFGKGFKTWTKNSLPFEMQLTTENGILMIKTVSKTADFDQNPKIAKTVW